MYKTRVFKIVFFLSFFLSCISSILCAELKPIRVMPLLTFQDEKDRLYSSVYDDNIFYAGVRHQKSPWLTIERVYYSSQRQNVASFTYNVEGGYVGYYLRLSNEKTNTFRQYNAIEFWVKGDMNELKVELKGLHVHSYVVRSITRQWTKVVIPFAAMTHFEKLEHKALKEIVFVLTPEGNKLKKGAFFIDDISFVYYKDDPLKVNITSAELRINNFSIDNLQPFEKCDLHLTASFQASESINACDVRFEVAGADGLWFLVDQEPIRSNSANGFWDASFYPAGEYRMRMSIVQGEKNVSRLKETSLTLLNDFDTDQFLAMVLKDTFQYFDKEYQTGTFLTHDRSGKDPIISTGACGFALAVYPLAAERGFISHDDALDRVISILDTYLNGVPSIHGFYQHWFDYAYQPVFEARGIDSVETSYLAAGALMCQNYYFGDSEKERRVRAKAKQLITQINWPFMLGGDEKQGARPIHWLYYDDTKEFKHPVIGFNECLITYIMALASPRPIPRKSFLRWYDEYTYKKYFDEKVVLFPTLFTQHYSFMFIDPRALRDEWVDYFANAQAVTLIQREYALRETNKRVWGLTACDGPEGYRAYGVDIPFAQSYYDGTISPSASIGSLPFTPIPVLANMKRMYAEYKELAYGQYGFYDSFNSDKKWSSKSYLGITQATIYLQIENYLGEKVWNVFMQDGRIQNALGKARITYADKYKRRHI
jgi:hypothetical protein